MVFFIVLHTNLSPNCLLGLLLRSSSLLCIHGELHFGSRLFGYPLRFSTERNNSWCCADFVTVICLLYNSYVDCRSNSAGRTLKNIFSISSHQFLFHNTRKCNYAHTLRATIRFF